MEALADVREWLSSVCNLYRIISNVEAMRRLFVVTDDLLDPPTFPEIYPDRDAPILRADAHGVRHLILARWGCCHRVR